MTKETVNEIKNNPKYQELVTKRSKFGWTLSIIILVVYYAFILFIAFSPETLGTKISPDGMMTWGIPVGIAIIIFAFTLTGIYVKRANSEFDGLLNDLKADLKGVN
ncbi:MAG: Putative membrane protein, clustering with ActP [uncultured Sulfurovum sp.]|uniref:Membrane protein, clustering with ActP n=1 Tax=uncultured Sulfurovum sp. TaxID=269237 RepID=A0A6S6RZA6_9BACT|nr:MAG: Putative membrane protein, clustering with ActP [uncultured Sulfurovum sp.]